jgi:hypothetical protein
MLILNKNFIDIYLPQMKKFPLLFFFFLFIAAKNFAQKEIQCSNEGIICCYDEQKKHYFLLDNENEYYESQNGRWVKKKYTFIGDKDLSFNEFNRLFRPISVKEKGLFFLHAGGGVLYHFFKDTIRRVDESFEWKSQYGSAFFSDGKTIFNFGGYGIFTEKNFTAKFDVNTRQWFKACGQSKTMPTERESSRWYTRNSKFYLLGGHQLHSQQGDILLNDVWSLDMKTEQWKKLGVCNKQITKGLEKSNVSSGSAEFLYFENVIYWLNLEKNYFKKFENNLAWNLKEIYSNQNSSELVLLNEDITHGIYSATLVQEADLFSKPLETGEIYTPEAQIYTEEQSKSIGIGIGIAATMAAVLFFLYFYRKNRKARELDEFQKNNLSALEQEILDVFFNHEHGIEIIQLDTFFNENNLPYATLRKRRETFLRSFRFKLHQLTAIPLDEIITESRLEKDKRVKLLQIHKDLKTKLFS